MSPHRPPAPTHTHHILSTQKIPQLKEDIYSFSNQVAIDITNLAVVFGETGVGQLTLKAWKDLQQTRWAKSL